MKNYKIINKTTWSTSDLKKLFDEVFKRRGYTPKNIEVGYTKKPGKIAGWAFGKYRIRMLLPNYEYHADEDLNVTKIKIKILDKEKYIIPVAQVLMHEIDHNLGLDHKEMIEAHQIEASYAKKFIIRRDETIKKNPTRKRMADFRYKGFVTRIYKYPNGYYYFMIYKENKGIYKSMKWPYINLGEVKQDIKQKIDYYLKNR